MGELIKSSAEITLNSGWPVPTAQFFDGLRDLSVGLYPQERIETMRGDGYKPIIIGYEHGSEGNSVQAIEDLFTHFRESDPQRQIKVALEIVPPWALRNIKSIHATKQQLARLKESLEPVDPDLESKIKELEEKAGVNDLATPDHRAMWLLENGFEVIPIEHESVAEWIAESGRLVRNLDSSEVSSEQVVQQLALGIRREIHGIQVLAEQRPDIIAVGYTHAFKYGAFLDPESNRSFYFFNFDPKEMDWQIYLQNFEKAYAHYRRENGSSN
jgi:hypothetical protein